ncbi:MAG: 30S ribosomal protein S17 [Rhodothermales bacterium]|nr:30S ribosomal protein S17 [Rhodothermales bacterium]
METVERKSRKERVGLVTSAKMDKSIVISIERQVSHPIYGKFIKKTSKIMAHDEENTAAQGDTVLVMETKPYSKNKRWRLVKVIERAK